VRLPNSIVPVFFNWSIPKFHEFFIDIVPRYIVPWPFKVAIEAYGEEASHFSHNAGLLFDLP
jgi:hypothetical protein